MWQGLLALKNDTAAVQLHFVSGNNVLAHRSLPLSEGGPPLRIAQRMRLEASQLEGVARRMTVSFGARASTGHALEGGCGSPRPARLPGAPTQHVLSPAGMSHVSRLRNCCFRQQIGL